MPVRKDRLVDTYNSLSEGVNADLLKQILVPSGRGGVCASRDYISASAKLVELHKVWSDSELLSLTSLKEAMTRVHPVVRFKLAYYTPCLASRFDELTKSQQDEILDNRDWVASVKQDGARGWAFLYKGEFFLFSRNYSDSNSSILNYGDHIYFPALVNDNSCFGVDVEIKFEPSSEFDKQEVFDFLCKHGLFTDSKREAISALLQMNAPQSIALQKDYYEKYKKPLIVFRQIAPLYFNHKNYVKEPLGSGIDAYSEVVSYGQKLGLPLLPIDLCDGIREEKIAFIDSLLSSGEEGVVFWNRKGAYCTSENRSKTSFIKLKRSVKDSLERNGMGDTIDGFVTGFKLGSDGTANENLVSALEISIYVQDGESKKKQVLAWIPNIPLSLKKKITVIENGEPKLIDSFYGQVVECNGQNISSVNHRLTHPRAISFRNDKTEYDCIYTKEFILSQIDGN